MVGRIGFIGGGEEGREEEREGKSCEIFFD